MLKKILLTLLILLAAVFCALAALLIWLTINEFSPEATEPAELVNMDTEAAVSSDGTLKLISFNTGYCALGKNADFFMDGGSSVRPDSRDEIVENNAGILSVLQREEADFYLLQEVDIDSKRSYGFNEAAAYSETLGLSTSFALNYSCDYVPYPIPTIGRVHAGLQTLARYSAVSAERIALPCPFSWPVSTANLKRCLLVSRYDIEGSDKQLVVINLHLEAYDDGEGKLAQTQALREFIEAEYENGSYVIAGGDFNQSFPGGFDTYPLKDSESWAPGLLTGDELPEGWSFAFDLSTPSCRLLDAPLSEDTQTYVIDGFILSPNIELVSVKCLDEGFTFSDHNPVSLEIALK